MKQLTVFCLLSYLLVSCMELGNQEISNDHTIVGSWSNIEYSETGVTMERVNNLKKNEYGYTFFSNGRMISRANSGWCGTPPIITNDYEGSWRLEDGKIIIDVPYWGGENIQEWQIISATNEKAVVNIHYVHTSTPAE